MSNAPRHRRSTLRGEGSDLAPGPSDRVRHFGLANEIQKTLVLQSLFHIYICQIVNIAGMVNSFLWLYARMQNVHPEVLIRAGSSPTIDP